MAIARFQTILLVFIFLLPLTSSSSIEVCPDKYCKGSDVPVHFPFRLDNYTSSRCYYPGFYLHCENKSQTIIQLPHTAGSFIVQNIDYQNQYLSISDPDSCMPRRYLDDGFNISGSKFTTEGLTNFTFLNCSSTYSTMTSTYGFQVYCLSGDNYSVIARTDDMSFKFYQSNNDNVSSSCHVIKSVQIPISGPFFTALNSDIQLYWREPDCGSCDLASGTCGFYTDDNSLDVGCSVSASSSSSSGGGLSTAAKYGISVGIGIPGLLCIVALTYFLCGKARVNRQARNFRMELSSINPQPMFAMSGGLAGSTIENFPKTLLGASRRLPNPSDNVCPICLSEYQSKEILRTIPECNHYFHSTCIDEWLRMNGTCPICRNSPDGSSSSAGSSSRIAQYPLSPLPLSSTLAR
ncbi:hypothetical protein ACFE04_006825 [Oxalis oulophora]